MSYVQPVFPMNINAPWGKYCIKSFLEFIACTRDQLAWLLKGKRSPHPGYTRADLEGYEAILALGCEETAKAFLELKAAAKDAGNRFPDNLAVIARLKAKGQWGQMQ